MRTSQLAPSSGVEIASRPRGAVASILEKEGIKNTILFDAFTAETSSRLGQCGRRSCHSRSVGVDCRLERNEVRASGHSACLAAAQTTAKTRRHCNNFAR